MCQALALNGWFNMLADTVLTDLIIVSDYIDKNMNYLNKLLFFCQIAVLYIFRITCLIIFLNAILHF